MRRQLPRGLSAPVPRPWELLVPLELRLATVGREPGKPGQRERSSGGDGGWAGGSQHHGQGLAATFGWCFGLCTQHSASPSTHPPGVSGLSAKAMGSVWDRSLGTQTPSNVHGRGGGRGRGLESACPAACHPQPAMPGPHNAPPAGITWTTPV